MPEAFNEDELATFASMEELQDKIAHFLANPEEREAIAARGQVRVLRDHCYTARMQTLLDFVAQRLPGWPKARATVQAAEGLPEDMALEISALLNRLSLPADTSFEDLVWAIRQQQGKLGELDAAVLFLDEWRKLYNKKGGQGA